MSSVRDSRYKSYCRVGSVEVLPIPLQWYLHCNRPDFKASRLETCCMLQAVIRQSLDYPGKAARQPSNGSFDSSAPTLLWLPPSSGRSMLKKAGHKKKKRVERWNGGRIGKGQMCGKERDREGKRREKDETTGKTTDEIQKKKRTATTTQQTRRIPFA